MLSIGVTGASGFIGKNMLAHIDQTNWCCAVSINHALTDTEIIDELRKCDCLIHLAGVNRPIESSAFKSGNLDFTNRIIVALEQANKKIPIIFASSIQAVENNLYGQSKHDAELAFLEYESKCNSPVAIFRLPNVFGKWCRSDYNSVVATFCNNIANGKEVNIHDGSRNLSLVYIDDVVVQMLEMIQKLIKGDDYCNYPAISHTYTIDVNSLAELLHSFKRSRGTLRIFDQSKSLERKLYSTYLSYLDKTDFDYPLEMKRDQRGWLAEFIKSDSFGQVFVSRTLPGVTRGNHWHHSKVEKFLVLSGNAEIKFRKLDEKEVIKVLVNGDELRVLDIPPGYTHSITNCGEEDLITLFWANEIFDPTKPDAFYVEV